MAAAAPQTTPPESAIEQSAAELVQLRDSLEHAQRLATLGTIAGLIAHEFNNLLTPIMSYAQMALDEPGNLELTRKALQRAAEGSEKASQIATAILDFARQDLDSALTSRELPTADVGTAVRAMYACLARDPRKDGMKFMFHGEHCGAARIRPVALQQVLLNLVLNARRAMKANDPGRPAELTISARRVTCTPRPPANAAVGLIQPDAAVEWIVIDVQDTGCGMTAEQLAKVFLPFTRGTAAGHGLGLTVCRQLLAQASGMLWATSTQDVGTCFTIAVPAIS